MKVVPETALTSRGDFKEAVWINVPVTDLEKEHGFKMQDIEYKDGKRRIQFLETESGRPFILDQADGEPWPSVLCVKGGRSHEDAVKALRELRIASYQIAHFDERMVDVTKLDDDLREAAAVTPPRPAVA